MQGVNSNPPGVPSSGQLPEQPAPVNAHDPANANVAQGMNQPGNENHENYVAYRHPHTRAEQALNMEFAKQYFIRNMVGSLIHDSRIACGMDSTRSYTPDELESAHAIAEQAWLDRSNPDSRQLQHSAKHEEQALGAAEAGEEASTSSHINSLPSTGMPITATSCLPVPQTRAENKTTSFKKFVFAPQQQLVRQAIPSSRNDGSNESQKDSQKGEGSTAAGSQQFAFAVVSKEQKLWIDSLQSQRGAPQQAIPPSLGDAPNDTEENLLANFLMRDKDELTPPYPVRPNITQEGIEKILELLGVPDNLVTELSALIYATHERCRNLRNKSIGFYSKNAYDYFKSLLPQLIGNPAGQERALAYYNLCTPPSSKAKNKKEQEGAAQE